MNSNNLSPNEQIASSVVTAMTGENVLSAKRMLTGDQNFVYAVETQVAEYVIRMTDNNHRYKFEAAIRWQNMLLPLGVPLAEFIKVDLDGQYSPYPALLMKRIPGDDLINVYSRLNRVDKKNLADEMASIQTLCTTLPDGPGYGILDSYHDEKTEKSWYEFLKNRLELYKEHIIKNAVFDPDMVTQVVKIANEMKNNLNSIPPRPFLWDASERNVLVYKGKISGIVDVDEICFGDPLFVIALTSTCLELEGFDTVYTDYWAAALSLDNMAQSRLNFYSLFYVIAFMGKHAMPTVNGKETVFDTDKLLSMYDQSLKRLDLIIE